MSDRLRASVGTVLLGTSLLLAPYQASFGGAWLALRGCMVVAAGLALSLGPGTSWTGRRLVGGVAGSMAIAWLVLEALGASRSVAPYPAWGRVGDVALVTLSYLSCRWLARGAPDERSTTTIPTLALVAALLPASVATLGLIGLVPGDGSGRMAFPYPNANALAGLFDLTCPMALALALFGTRPWRWIALAGAALLLTAQGATFSRGATIATAIALLVLLVAWTVDRTAPGRSRRVGLAAGLLTLALALAVAFVVGSPRLRGTVADRLVEVTQLDRSARLRNAVWQGSILLVRQHPLTGVGPGQVGNAVVGTRPDGPQTDAQQALETAIGHAHNDLLQVAAEAGIPAAIAFLLFWLAVLRTAFDATLGRPWRWGIAGGLLALLLHGLVDVNLSMTPANAVLAAAVGASMGGRARSPGSPPPSGRRVRGGRT